MAYYRCYFLSRDNSFTSVNDVYSDTDSDAIVQASMLVAESPQTAGFELWEGGRQVCKHVSSATRRPPSRAAAVITPPPASADCPPGTARLLAARYGGRGPVMPLTLSEARRICAASAASGATPAYRRSY